MVPWWVIVERLLLLAISFAFVLLMVHVGTCHMCRKEGEESDGK